MVISVLEPRSSQGLDDGIQDPLSCLLAPPQACLLPEMPCICVHGPKVPPSPPVPKEEEARGEREVASTQVSDFQEGMPGFKAERGGHHPASGLTVGTFCLGCHLLGLCGTWRWAEIKQGCSSGFMPASVTGWQQMVLQGTEPTRRTRPQMAASISEGWTEGGDFSRGQAAAAAAANLS